MKRVLNGILSIIWILLTATVMPAYAQNTEKFDLFTKYDFYIQNYDVFLTVDTERNVNIQEIVTLRVNNPEIKEISHIIPKMHGRISDVRVSVPYEENNGLDKLRLKIQTEAALKKSRIIQYKVSYNHQLFSDENNFDFQIIKPEWKVPVQQVRFKLQLPENVRQDSVHLYIDGNEIKNIEDGAEYIMKEDRIIGRTTADGLRAQQSFRIKINVPADFFVANGKHYAAAVWVGLLLLTLISFLVWCMYAQDDHIPTIISHNPPRGISAGEAELLHDGALTEKGLIAMIISLANRGYLTIDTIGKNFTLNKQKNYTGRNYFMKKTMQILFEDKDVAESSDLKASNRFSNGWAQICDTAGKPDMTKRFQKKSEVQFFRRILMLACLIGNVLLTLFAVRNYLFSEEYLLLAALIIVSIAVAIKLFSKNLGLMAKIIGLVFLFYILYLLMFGCNGDMCKEDILQIIVGIGCTMISFICYIQMPKPNTSGRVYKGQLFGLKNFIKFADKNRLGRIMHNNPSYFYKILPYAYVLEMHNEWIKLFDDMEIPMPLWTENNNFKIRNFMRNFPSGITAALTASSLCKTTEETKDKTEK
ncbi:MAG: DUF2207 domain-containing protein [Alphaproteobacteria bacterium]|nr:DUF2207 domain-containing protein [Alphaproteobacteria bacterium]